MSRKMMTFWTIGSTIDWSALGNLETPPGANSTIRPSSWPEMIASTRMTKTTTIATGPEGDPWPPFGLPLASPWPLYASVTPVLGMWPLEIGAADLGGAERRDEPSVLHDADARTGSRGAHAMECV